MPILGKGKHLLYSTDEFCRRPGATSHMQALFLMGNFIHSSICWRDSAPEHRKLRRFLKRTDDHFLTQVIEKCLTRPHTEEQRRAPWGWGDKATLAAVTMMR